MNKQLVNGKRLLVSVWLALFANTFCIPLWTECDYVGFVCTLFNKEARISLLYSGGITKAEPFHVESIPQPSNAWWSYVANNIHCSNLSLRAKGKWQRLSLKLKIQRDGRITMFFKGPNVRDEYGSFYSALIDWRNVKINGKTILSKAHAFSFKKPFTRQVSVKKGDVLHIEAEFRRHHFSIHDFAGLKSGKLWYIITGNILVFFLIYRLLSYIQGGGIRKADVLLLAIFFSMLFIPMSGVSDAVKSVRENRMLAVKPVLRDILKKGLTAGDGYENWFNDHFCGRVPLIKLHDVLRNKLSSVIRTGKALYFKKIGWLFLVPLISNLDCRPFFLQSIVQNIVQLNEFCQQNQIKLYVLEVPKKEVVYKELIKENYGFDEKMLTKVTQAQEFVRKEVRKHHIPYIYPYNALRAAAKSHFSFFKCNHHWTDWGAFVGYCELMKEIRKDFPDMPIVSLNEFRKSRNWLIRDVWDDAFLPSSAERALFNYRDADDPPNRAFYNYYDHENGAEMYLKIGKFTKSFTYPKGKNKIMLIGTSQNDNLVHFLPYSAAQLKYIRVNLEPVKEDAWFKILKLYGKDISAFKPDILILSLGPDDMPRLSIPDLCASK